MKAGKRRYLGFSVNDAVEFAVDEESVVDRAGGGR
jgi:hypothetical protein